ncbi:MAG: PepSY-associated TM helix domain-containing protein [Muribaculaceae bacterium]
MKHLLKQIHLWLSVPFGIIITLICFSGATMVYEKEITEWCQPELYKVAEVKDQALPLNELMEMVEETLPDSVEITGVTVSPDVERPYQVSLSKPRRASLFVDQYTGEVKGQYQRLPFFDTMFRLHRWLLGSAQTANGGMSAGKWLVGTSTLILVIILITGILMWLTNKRKPLKKSLSISVTKGWGRFWHDLHVAGGIYTTIFLLAIALTGLTWSFSWYRSGFYSMFGVEASAGGEHGGHGSHGREGQRDGQREHNAEAHSFDRESHGHGGAYHNHGYHNHNHDSNSEYHHDNDFTGGGNPYYGGGHRRSPYRHWQDLLENMQEENPGYRQITLKKGSVEVVPAGRNSLRATDKYSYDRRSGEITDTKPYSAEEKSTKVRSAVYMVHVGSWGGWITRLITFIAALIGATLPLTGYYLWIRRLRKKHLAAKQNIPAAPGCEPHH